MELWDLLIPFALFIKKRKINLYVDYVFCVTKISRY